MAVRREAVQNVGKTKAAKLVPVNITAVKGNEGGLYSGSVAVDLDPVAGRLLTQAFAKVTCVYVPIQAIEALRTPDVPENAMTEVIRRKLMNGTSLYAYVPESDVSKYAGVNPINYGGQKQLLNCVTGAYNVAVNYVRKRKYVYATERAYGVATIAPAVIHETVLDLFNAVLDPDDRVNGQVSLDFNNERAYVVGITQENSGTHTSANATLYADASRINFRTGTPGTGVNFMRKEGNPGGQGLDIYADLSQIEAGGFSLSDLYSAQKADELVRRMREIANANPLLGEDAVLRWCYGLQAENQRFPFTLYEERIALGERRQAATDAAGIQDEVMVSQLTDTISFSVPVPKTELGGIIVTLLQVTPEEVIQSQPHPLLCSDWVQPNHAADSLKVDPVPVPFRELFSDVPRANEFDQKFYTGFNEMKRNYVTFGFNRSVDPNEVSTKSVVWSYAIPAGVSPDNINYPEDFSQYPFLDQTARVVTYSASYVMSLETDMFFGPTPVEKVAIVDDRNLLGES